MKGKEARASVRVLLSGLVDYAGLFPPSQLSMPAALENLTAYRGSQEAWMLGRFIVPSTRLDECAAVLERLRPGSPVSLNVLLTSVEPSDLHALVKFNELHGETIARITSIETRISSVGDATRIARALGDRFPAFCEIPLVGDVAGMIEETAGTGLRAKIRTGGVTPESIPGSSDIIRFLFACATKRLPFKATAGLHHPLRGTHALTYEPGSLRGTMHGFLNLFLASAFLVEGMEVAEAIQLMEETNPEAFTFDERRVRWRSREISVDRLSMVRRGFAMAFGSCSFVEPVAELKELNLL
jgi:hypothetical protein